MALTTPLNPRTAIERAISMPIGMLVGGVVRLVFDASTELNYILKNKTVVTWTIIAGIIIPVAALVLLSIAKANQDKNAKLARGLAIPVLFMMIGGVLGAILGMCYFPDYSYTFFDTFVKDFVNLARNGMDYFVDVIDDVFVLIVLVMAAQGISLVGKFLSPATAKPETYYAAPAQPPAQAYAQPQPYAQPYVQPASQPYVESSYQSYVQRPSQPYAQPAPQQPVQAPAMAAGPAFSKFCRFCGAKLPDQAHFCGNCGRQLSKPSTSMAAEPIAEPERAEPASPGPVYIPMQPAAAPVTEIPVAPAVSATASVITPKKASTVTYVEPATLVSPQEPVSPVPAVTMPAAAPPVEVTTTVAVPSPAAGPSTPGPTILTATTSPTVPSAEVPFPSGTATLAPAQATLPAEIATPAPPGTKGTVDWAQAGVKTKAFFRQFTRWDTTKAFFRWLGSKIEQGFGWAYQKAFKKVPNQKTTWSCMLLMAGIVVAFIIVGAALTPGPFLAGTWRTAFVTNFNIQTTASGSLQYVGSEQRTMTWTISRTFNPTVVSVDVSFVVVSKSISGMYVPDVSPNTYEGRISGTRLTLVDPESLLFEERIVGEFSFTSTSIMGTWNDSWTGMYFQMVYTSVNGLTLVR